MPRERKERDSGAVWAVALLVLACWYLLFFGFGETGESIARMIAYFALGWSIFPFARWVVSKG
jgi:hypothetical protein